MITTVIVYLLYVNSISMGPEIRLYLLFWNDKYMSCLTKRQELLKRLFNRFINNGTEGRGMPIRPEFFFRSKEYEIQKDIERQKYRKGKLKNVSEEGRHLHTPAFGDRFHHKVGAVAYVGH